MDKQWVATMMLSNVQPFHFWKRKYTSDGHRETFPATGQTNLTGVSNYHPGMHPCTGSKQSSEQQQSRNDLNAGRTTLQVGRIDMHERACSYYTYSEDCLRIA
jgi:hypothetical protein